MHTATTRRPVLSLMLAWVMVLVASRSAAGGGEEELKAGLDLYNKGDHAGALLKWRDAADNGNAIAMRKIGVLYYKGEGVKQDYIEAMRWYRKATDKGDADAMFNIGILYANGRGVKQDYIEAMRCYRRAADKGNARAMSNIGFLYTKGRGVKQDYQEAMRWYRKAADTGNARAMSNIGILYANGRGVKQDYIEAMRWYRRAAATDKGDADNMFNIGRLYYNGQGVQRDLKAALHYFQLGQTSRPDDYTAMRIWLCLTSLGRDKAATERVNAYRSKHKPKGWPGSILGFMSGDVHEAKLLEDARSRKGRRQSERLCEACFYIGSAKLFAEEREAAISFFRKCIDTGVSTFDEYRSAKAELKRLRDR